MARGPASAQLLSFITSVGVFYPGNMSTSTPADSPRPFLYRTMNRHLAEALLTRDFPLIEATRTNGLVFFTFPVSPELFDAAERYWQATAYLDELIDEHSSHDGTQG